MSEFYLSYRLRFVYVRRTQCCTRVNYHSSAEQKEDSGVLRVGNVCVVDSDSEQTAGDLVVFFGGVYLLWRRNKCENRGRLENGTI